MGKKDYIKQFNWHYQDAKLRGIDFLFDYEKWLKFWEDSGYLPERGHKKGQYVMARFGDIGPYAPWNVKIVTCSENISEGLTRRPKTGQHKNKMRKPKSQEHRDKIVSRIRGKGWRRPRMNADKVREIRRLYQLGFTIKEICKKLDVAPVTAWSAATHASWKNVI